MISPSIHREIARQREADFLRDADRARLAAQAPKEVQSVFWFTRGFALLEGLTSLARRRPQPAR